MILVQANRNVLFITFLFSIKFPKLRAKQELYRKTYRELKEIIPKEFWNNFTNVFPKDSRLSLLYKFTYLSLFLNDNFEFVFTKEEKESFEKIDSLSKCISFINTELKKLYDDIDFNSFYEKYIKDEYQKLCSDIDKIFLYKPHLEKDLCDFWGIKSSPKLIFIPNFPALGDCFGFQRENTFYSITSSKISPKTGKAEYYPIHVYSNTIHEFSHSFLHEVLETKYSREDLNRKLKKLSLKEDVLNTYNTAYFEECFIRASTMRIKEITNIYELDSKELKGKVSNYLLSNDNLGYPLVRTFYDALSVKGDKSISDVFNKVVGDV